jgi:hypothetical protein
MRVKRGACGSNRRAVAGGRGTRRACTASVGERRGERGGEFAPARGEGTRGFERIFDEAADDPGLRFVIVAALLFLLFLFILLFSYILG